MKKTLSLFCFILSFSCFSQSESETKFTPLEKAPVYKGCNKSWSNAELKQCMSKKLTKLINRKFNTRMATQLGLKGRQRIFVAFKINTKGKVVDIKVRAPHPKLQKEAERVIKQIPKLKPGMADGEPVTVPYALPIIFTV